MKKDLTTLLATFIIALTFSGCVMGPEIDETKTYCRYTIEGTADSAAYHTQWMVYDSVVHKEDYPFTFETYFRRSDPGSSLDVIIWCLSDTGYIRVTEIVDIYSEDPSISHCTATLANGGCYFN